MAVWDAQIDAGGGGGGRKRRDSHAVPVKGRYKKHSKIINKLYYCMSTERVSLPRCLVGLYGLCVQGVCMVHSALRNFSLHVIGALG